MLDKAAYIATLHQDAASFAATARQHTEPPVPQIPTCPNWNMTGLLLHLGGGHRLTAKRLRDGETTPAKLDQDDKSYLKLPPEWLEWAKTGQAPADKPLPTALIQWFEEGAAELEEVFKQAEPEAPVWNWFGSGMSKAGAFQQQMAIETAIHRCDAQSVQSEQQPTPINGELARDGIDLLFGFLPMLRKRLKEPVGQGELYHFHRTDGPGEWLLGFNGDEVTVKQEHAKGDVAIRGTASDLLLFLWRRIPAERLEVFGDSNLIKRYFELVPAI